MSSHTRNFPCILARQPYIDDNWMSNMPIGLMPTESRKNRNTSLSNKLSGKFLYDELPFPDYQEDYR